jgi:DNA-binding XRE family transcriptional regulator
MQQDIRAYDEAKKAVEEGEELVLGELVYAILDGAHPIRAWREYRGLTQGQLAQVAEISVPCLSQLESGKRKGSRAVLSAIAAALDLDLDDVVPPVPTLDC